MSTEASDLMMDLQRLGVVLTPNGDMLRVKAPEGVITPKIMQRLTDTKLELLELLKVPSKPRLVVCNPSSVKPSRQSTTSANKHDLSRPIAGYRLYKVEVDGRYLTFIDYSNTDDIHALMVRKFGAERVGDIQEPDSSKNAV